jgi:DNA-directed RNA polymerase specialized sigma24 family protein
VEPASQAAWAEFVVRYGPKVQAWCRRWNVQEADAQDVTQIVLTQLSVKLRGFDHDPSRSFRAWLKTLTQHAWSDLAAHRRRAYETLHRVWPGVPFGRYAPEGDGSTSCRCRARAWSVGRRDRIMTASPRPRQG